MTANAGKAAPVVHQDGAPNEGHRTAKAFRNTPEEREAFARSRARAGSWPAVTDEDAARDLDAREVDPFARWATSRVMGHSRSVRSCGLSPIEGEDGGARVSLGGGLFGVKTCGSPWSCPHCAASLARERQGWARHVALGAEQAGAVPRLVLLTLRHNVTERLADLIDKVMRGWASTFGAASRTGKTLRQGGLVAAIRGLEVTRGKHGWHPHLHVVTWWTSEGAAVAAERTVRAAWESAVGKIDDRAWGWEEPRDVEASARYAAKAGSSGIGYAVEGTAGQRHSSVWSVLDRISAGTASHDDFRLWEEYGAATAGRRALGTVQRGTLDAWAAWSEEREPEEVPEDETEVGLSQPWLALLWRYRLLGFVTRYESSFGVLAWAAGETPWPSGLARDVGLSIEELVGAIRSGVMPV